MVDADPEYPSAVFTVASSTAYSPVAVPAGAVTCRVVDADDPGLRVTLDDPVTADQPAGTIGDWEKLALVQPLLSVFFTVAV